MGLEVKRCFNIKQGSKLDLQEKITKINLGKYSLFDLLHQFVILNDNTEDIYTIDTIKKEKNKVILLDKFNKYIDDIRNSHKKDTVKLVWESIQKLNIGFDDPSNGPNKLKAEEEYNNLKLNFFEKTFRFLGERKKSEFENKIEIAKEKDFLIYDSYKNLQKFSSDILNKDIDAYFIVIDELNPFSDFIKYGSELNFGCNDGNSIEIEFIVNSKDIVPNFNIILEDEKIKKEEMEKTLYYDIVQDYVCSATLKIAKQTMDLLPVEKVIIHAVDKIINSQTKEYNDIVILSALFDKRTMDKLSLKNMESTFAIDNFICNMRHQDTDDFKSVKKITQY